LRHTKLNLSRWSHAQNVRFHPVRMLSVVLARPSGAAEPG
jgi:hypothetical protein